MKKMITLLSLIVMSSSAYGATTVTGLNPKSNVSKVYEFWMGKTADCTNMVKVIDLGTDGKEVDTELGVDVGSGSLPPAGTYNCLAIVVSDASTMQPATTGGTGNTCDATKHYSHRTFRNSDTTILPSDPNTTITPNGKNGVGGSSDFVPQKVAAYFSTSGTNGGSGHTPATALPLAGGAVTVGTDSMSKTFFVSCAGKVTDGQDGTIIVETGAAGSCATDACQVGFR